MDKVSNTLTSTHSLRIAFCLPEAAWLGQVMDGGLTEAASIQQEYIAAGLRRRGHRLTYIAPQDLNQMLCTNDPMQLTVAPQTWSKSHWFTLISKLAWQMQRRLGIPYLNFFSNYRRMDACIQCLPGHDLVYERQGMYNVGVAMACKRLGLPYVLFFDADQIMELKIMGKPLPQILQWRASQLLSYNLEAANCIICVSEEAKRHLMNHWRVPGGKIVIFSNGVDVQRFQPCPEARAEVRTTLGLDQSPMLLFVGNFYQWHDVKTLLDAFALLLTTKPEARLVLVGDGPQRQAMMQHAASLGVTHAVCFTGLVPHAEIPRLIGAADIAVAPVPVLDRDLWLSPMKLFEYMATGVAIVASSVGQLRQIIRDGSNGLLTPPGDSAALAALLCRLLNDPELCRRLGRQAREDAVRNYSWEEYVARLERLWGAVIANQSISEI